MEKINKKEEIRNEVITYLIVACILLIAIYLGPAITGFAILSHSDIADFSGSINQTNVDSENITLANNPTNTEYRELPASSVDGWANMTGNVLYVRLNNDSDYNGGNESHIYDYSGNGNNGTAIGATANMTHGKINGSFEFDGSDDHQRIDCGNDSSLDIIDETTFHAWIKIAETPVENGDIIDKNKAGWFYIRTDSLLDLKYHDGTSWREVVGDSAIPAGKWTHVVATHEASGANTLLKIYINGQLDNSDTLTGRPTPASSGLRIGSYGAYDFNGSIDEVAIWNRSLSSTEITTIYENTKIRYYTDGTYTSNIVDATENATWQSFKWTNVTDVGEIKFQAKSCLKSDCSQTEFPDSSADSEINMTGNVLLMHFNSNFSATWNETLDTSGNNNNGTAGNHSTLSYPGFISSGKLNSGFEFDGLDDYIKILDKDSLDLGPDMSFTIVFWVKPKGSIDDNDFWISKESGGWNGWWIWESGLAVDEIRFGGSGADRQILSTLPGLDVWTHIVVTYDEGYTQLRSYVNGQLDMDIDEDLDITTNDEHVYISFDPGTDRFFNGTIDEVAIWNRSLSASEIKNIYDLQKDFIGPDNTPQTYFTENITLNTTLTPDNQYFQYKAWFSTTNVNQTPYLMSADIESNIKPSQSIPFIGAELETGNSLTSHGYNESIVGYWKLNRYGSPDESKVLDETGINNGTLYNFDNTSLSGPTYSGRIGGGWNFDGVDDYVNVGNDASFNITDEITISAWVKPSTASQTGYAEILGRIDTTGAPYEGYELQVDNSNPNKFRLRIAGASTTHVYGTTTLSVDVWYHVVGTYDSSTTTCKIYVNGVEENDDTSCVTLQVGSGASNALIGKNPTGAYYWNGTIDEVTIWNRSLSADEIMEIYLDGFVNGTETIYTTQDLGVGVNNSADADNDNLTSIFNWYEDNVSIAVLNMPFDSNDSCGTNCTKDYSSRGNDGTLVNAFWNASGIDKDIPGLASGAMVFDGVDDYVDLGNDNIVSGASTITISYWIKPRSVSDTNTALVSARDGSNGAETRIENDEIACWIGNGTDSATAATTDFNLAVNTWYNILCTYDGTTIKIYKNSVVSSITGTTSGDIGTTTSGLSIGTDNDQAAGKFNGTIDEVMIFNRSLSAEQVKQLYLKNYNVLVSEETNKSRSYKAEVIVNDGYEDSLSYNTTEITILNSAPAIPSIVNVNNSIYNDNFVIQIENSTGDADSDAITYYLEVYNDSALSEINYVNSSITETVNTTNETYTLNGNGSFYARVLATDTSDNSSWSEIFMFSTAITSEFSGKTTDLSEESDLTNITAFTIENPSSGMINFTESVNLSGGADLDAHVNISFNRIEVDSIALSDLDKAARLTLYNLTYEDPEVLKNSASCPGSVCREISYDKTTGTFVFTVTGFSVYTTKETPNRTRPPPPVESVRQPGALQREFYINMQAGQTELIGIVDLAYVYFNQDKYFIDVKGILGDSVELKIGYNLIKIEMGKVVYLDLDGDKLADLRVKLEEIIENQARLSFKEVISEAEKEIVVEEKEEVKEEVKKISLKLDEEKKSLLRSYLDRLKVSFTELFTSDVVKEIKTKEKLPYLVIGVIILIIILSVFLERNKAKPKNKLIKNKKDLKKR